MIGYILSFLLGAICMYAFLAVFVCCYTPKRKKK